MVTHVCYNDSRMEIFKPKFIMIGVVLVAAAASTGVSLRRLQTGSSPVSTQEQVVVQQGPRTPEERDSARYAHANQMRLALASYQRQYRNYPEELKQLVPSYLPQLPVDPTTFKPYDYVKDSGGFSIKFSLEKGIFTLSAGEHTLTSRGFDIVTAIPQQSAQSKPAAVNVIPPPEEPINPLPPMETKEPNNPSPPSETETAGSIVSDANAGPSEPTSQSDTGLPGVASTEIGTSTTPQEAANPNPAEPIQTPQP